jgi:hypothetical protein
VAMADGKSFIYIVDRKIELTPHRHLKMTP